MGLEDTLTWEFHDPGRGFRSPGNDREGTTLGLPPADFVPPEAGVNCVTFISSLELRRGRELKSWLPDCCFTRATAAYTQRPQHVTFTFSYTRMFSPSKVSHYTVPYGGLRPRYLGCGLDWRRGTFSADISVLLPLLLHVELVSCLAILLFTLVRHG